MLVNHDGLYMVLLIITPKDKLRVMMLSLALKLHDSRREIPFSKLNTCAKPSLMLYLLTIKGHPASLKIGFNFPTEKSISASVRSVTLLTVLGMRLTASW
jgi:hypothetical protein